MKERIYHLLNLKVSESKHVFDLLKIQLFIGIAHSFTNIAAFTYFIFRFSIDSLAYAYLGVAGALLVLNLVYEKLEHRLSPLQLLRYIVLFSGAVLFLFWTGFLAISENTLIFLLVIWSVLFYMITGYAYWGLVSLLFNVRESKRVFSIVGAGDIPAKLIGYISAPFLISLVGISNLLGFALLSLAIGLFFVTRLIKKERLGTFKIKKHKHHHSTNTKSPQNVSLKGIFFFKHRLIFAISLLSLLSYNVFNLIDFTFISQIKVRYQDISVLASFIAIFFAIGRIGALVLKLIFTSRMIERLGVIASLLITPAVLFIFSFIYLSLDDRSDYSLYFFGIMALFTEILRSAIQEPSFFILFQPLNESTRLKGHIIAKGYMLPPSLLIVGGSLLLIRNMHIDLNILFTIKILLVNLCLWAVLIYYLRKEYIKTLHQSIARGIFHGEELHIYDKKTIDILLQKLDSPSEKEIIYALRLLEKGGYEGISQLLLNFIGTDKVEVRKYAFGRLADREEVNAETLRKTLENENDLELKGQIIYNLCKLDLTYLESASAHLSELDSKTRKHLIVHLINQAEFNYLFKAGNEINNLIRSEIAAERELALEIIGELKNIRFTTAIEQLIEDPEPSVKRNALIAACKLQSRNLLPVMFQMLLSPANKYLVLQSLFHYGDNLFKDLDILTEEAIEKNKSELIKIASKVKGNASTEFLLAQLQHTMYLEKVVHALWSKGFDAQMASHIHSLQVVNRIVLQQAQDKIEYYFGLQEGEPRQLIKDSLFSEVKNDLLTTLRICAMMYHKKEINRILELIENGDRDRIYNAMEMLEQVLPRKTAKQINLLLDFVLEPTPGKKKPALLSPDQLFSNIILSPAHSFNTWTKAVCIYSFFKNNEIDKAKLKAIEFKTYPVLSEIKHHVLSIQQPAYADH